MAKAFTCVIMEPAKNMPWKFYLVCTRYFLVRTR